MRVTELEAVVDNLARQLSAEGISKFAAEKNAQDYSDRLIREQERSRVYKELYEDVNAERKLLSERMQEFSGFIRIKKQEIEGERNEPIPVGRQYIPWRQAQKVLRDKLIQAENAKKEQHWKEKGGVNES